MQVFFDLRDPASFPLQPGLPANYRGYILKGSVALSGKNAIGNIILQNFTAGDFAIQYGVYEFIQKCRCSLRPPVFSTGSILALKQNLKTKIQEIGSLNYREGQVAMLEYGDGHFQHDFKANKQYHILEISCSSDILKQNLHYFPHLDEQIKKFKTTHTAYLIIPQQPAGQKALQLVEEMLNSPFQGGTNEETFAHKAREYFWELMLISSKSYPKLHLSKEEENRIWSLGDHLRLQPNKRFPIQHLARYVGMNEMKLKLAFKYFFGKGILEFHLDQRMEQARQLLKEGEIPIKEIANLVGYEHTTSFITKFREYFGYSPSHIQKK